MKSLIISVKKVANIFILSVILTCIMRLILNFQYLHSFVFQTKMHLCVILSFNMRLTVFTKIFGQSLKINRLLTDLSRQIWAHQYVISIDPAPTLKNYSHLERRLIDMPHIFSESLDNSEQNLHRCILIFFLKIFWVGPL